MGEHLLLTRHGRHARTRVTAKRRGRPVVAERRSRWSRPERFRYILEWFARYLQLTQDGARSWMLLPARDCDRKARGMYMHSAKGIG
jgi:hypothetical protein